MRSNACDTLIRSCDHQTLDLRDTSPLKMDDLTLTMQSKGQ
jgi:hypothetical protein